MNSKNSSSSGEENQTKDLESVRALLAFKGRYHDHKETMAHAAILIQLGILAVLFRMDSWAPLDSSRRLLVMAFYILMWAIVSWYMLWQLDNRKEAAEDVNKLIKALADKANHKNRKEADEDVNKFIDLRVLIQDMKGISEGAKMGACILWTADVLILIIALLRMFIPW